MLAYTYLKWSPEYVPEAGEGTEVAPFAAGFDVVGVYVVKGQFLGCNS